MRQFEQLPQVFSMIDDLLKTPGTKIIAIDGNSGAGKSTLAFMIAERCDCNVFHMDDYYLSPSKKTEERLKEAGGNVDRERFQAEILYRIRSGECFTYHRYDCQRQTFFPSAKVCPKRLNLVEGVYSMHPELAPYYDLKFFLELDAAEQSRRILSRNGPRMHKRFLEEWIPLENQYFTELKIKESCDLIIKAL